MLIKYARLEPRCLPVKPGLSDEKPSRWAPPFKEDTVGETTASEATPLGENCPSSGPKVPRPAEKSSSSSEKISHSSNYESAPERPWVRCAYVTQVRAVKGVAVEWLTKTSFDPVGDMPQVFEAELSQESTIGSAPSLEDTRSLISVVEPWQEETEPCTQEPSIQEEEEEAQERPRATTPDWMVTCEHGLRCVACCRIFTSWEALKEHAEHGVKQGFSCRVFYEEMLERQLEPSVPRRPRRCHKLERRFLMASKRREIEEMEEACRHLEKQLEEELKEVKRLKRQVVKLEKKEAQSGPGQRGKRLKTT